MKEPKISVIVPVYNTEQWLRRCVDSILAQTFTDFELLLIDDGSTDGSGAICDEYAKKDSRVRVFHKPNGGVSSARNLGLDNARGQWITFADSDDYVAPEWLMNYNVEKNCDKALINQGLVKFKYNEGTDSVQLAKQYRGSNEGNVNNVLSSLYHLGMLGWIHIKAFNGKYLKERKTSFDESQNYREDEKFIMEFLQPTDKLILYDVVGYFYQISDTNKYDDWKCIPEFSKCIYDNVVRLGFEPGSALRDYFANEYKATLLKYIKNGSPDKKTLTSELKQLVKQEYNHIGLFPPTKFLLRYDKTGLLSTPVLRLHLSLKSN